MESKTLLAILYANGMENVVSRAIAIDNELITKTEAKTIRVEVQKDKLTAGKQFKDNKSYGNIECPIIGFNPLKLQDEYLVQLPNGDTKWTSLNNSEYRTLTITEVIDIPVKEPVLS